MIRQCTEEDLPRLFEIARAAWEKIFDYLEDAYGKELYNTVAPDCHNSKTPSLKKHFANHPDRIYVAERNGKVVGFICFNINHTTHTGEIGNNAVDPACGEKGVGQEMYKAVLQRFRDEGCLAAMVTTGGDPAHAPARRAYERAGFKLKTEQVFYIMDLREDQA